MDFLLVLKSNISFKPENFNLWPVSTKVEMNFVRKKDLSFAVFNECFKH